MPIRINLLAEAQAAAEMRRKDPVKRGIWIGSCLVCLMLLWIIKLRLDIYFEQKTGDNMEADWKDKTAKYNAVTGEKAKIDEVNGKLAQLDYLQTNRFLWAPVLDALQKTMVDQIQVLSIRGEQAFTREDPRDIGVGNTHNFIPGAEIEKESLYIQAKDFKPSDQNYDKYKEKLCAYDFFARRLKRRDGFVLDGVLSPLTVDPVDPGKQFVTFTLASHFPEIRRND